MKLTRLAGMLLAAMVLSGCVALSSSDDGEEGLARYNAAVQSWTGAQIDEVMGTWPRPWFKGQTMMDDTTSVYGFIRTEEYFQEAVQYFDHANNEWKEKSPARNELLICETKFIVDSQGLVTSVKGGGYQCGKFSTPPARP